MPRRCVRVALLQQQQSNADYGIGKNPTYDACQCAVGHTFSETHHPPDKTTNVILPPTYAQICYHCAVASHNTAAMHPANVWSDELLYTFIVDGEATVDFDRLPRKFRACPELGCGKKGWGYGDHRTMARCLGCCKVKNRGGGRVFKPRKVKKSRGPKWVWRG